MGPNGQEAVEKAAARHICNAGCTPAELTQDKVTPVYRPDLPLGLRAGSFSVSLPVGQQCHYKLTSRFCLCPMFKHTSSQEHLHGGFWSSVSDKVHSHILQWLFLAFLCERLCWQSWKHPNTVPLIRVVRGTSPHGVCLRNITPD